MVISNFCTGRATDRHLGCDRMKVLVLTVVGYMGGAVPDFNT